MKTNVHILDSKIETSRLFESNLAKIINDELNTYAYEDLKSIVLTSIGMSWKGHGQYDIVLNLELDDFDVSLRRHSTDSQLYDKLYNDDISERTRNNAFKRLTLSMLREKVERLVDDLTYENITEKLEITKQN